MSHTTIYPYSSSNGIRTPQNYQYSKFNGINFLNSYKNSRLEVINFLKEYLIKRIGKIKNKEEITELYYFYSVFSKYVSSDIKMALNTLFKIISPEDVKKHTQKITVLLKKKYSFFSSKLNVNTNEIMQVLFFSLTHPKSIISEKIIDNWLNEFVKNYEVSKKIYSHYSSNFKSFGRDFFDIKNYVLFSLNLSLFYQKTRNLKFLNTLLKVNDMLCSNKKCVTSSLNMLLCYIAIKMELKEVKDLYMEKRISI